MMIDGAQGVCDDSAINWLEQREMRALVDVLKWDLFFAEEGQINHYELIL